MKRCLWETTFTVVILHDIFISNNCCRNSLHLIRNRAFIVSIVGTVGFQDKYIGYMLVYVLLSAFSAAVF